jgi:hypothetical protein
MNKIIKESKMTEAQIKELKRLIYQYGNTREELGTVPSSMYWNSANALVEKAEKELYDYLATLQS